MSLDTALDFRVKFGMINDHSNGNGHRRALQVGEASRYFITVGYCDLLCPSYTNRLEATDFFFFSSLENNAEVGPEVSDAGKGLAAAAANATIMIKKSTSP